MKLSKFMPIMAAVIMLIVPSFSWAQSYLEITLNIKDSDRSAASEIYKKYKQPFLKEIDGAKSKELLVRDEDVQVLHGFDTTAQAQDYLKSHLFNDDVVRELGPLLQSDPEVRIYEAN